MMINKRGLKLFVLFTFLFILSSFLISAQFNTEISFRYEGKTYFYNTSSGLYETLFTGERLAEVPYGAENLRGFIEGFKVEPGFFDNLGQKIASSSFIKYTFGTRGSDNIFQRGLAFLGYGDELKEYASERYCLFTATAIIGNTNYGFLFGTLIIIGLGYLFWIRYKTAKRSGLMIFLILAIVASVMFCAGIGFISRGLGAIYLAGMLCWTLLCFFKKIIQDVDIKVVQDLSESFIFKFKTSLSFANMFTLIFGSIFILLNIPGISILRPLFWPLFTDYGISLGLPFALEVTNPNAGPFNFLFGGEWTSYWIDYITISGSLIGLMLLRALVFGLITFLFLIILTTLINAHKLITDIIIHYQSEKRKIKAQEKVDNISYFAQAADTFAKA